jgi:integrase-like protein
MVSVDFFTVPTVQLRVLYVFIVLAHDRRRVLHFTVTEHPTAAWTAQQIVQAFPDDSAPRYLVRARSPWQNCYAERMIGSIRRECLNQVIVINEWHLRRILKSYFSLVITIDGGRISRWIRMLRNPDPFRIYRLAGLFKSGKSADCTIATNAGPRPHSWVMRLLESIADFFNLSWHLLRSLFMSQEALEQEIAEMRRQIAELKAEAAQAANADKDAARSGRSWATPFHDLWFALTVFAVDEYWRITGVIGKRSAI